MSKKTLYFLCTGNSCRSQMAEGWGKKYLGNEWEVFSAGIEAHGVNEKAVQSMEEVGVDISNQTSDMIDLTILNNADLLSHYVAMRKIIVQQSHHMFVNIGDLMILRRL